ncbi:MAG: hypothetical protein Q4P29_02390 [Tissierellia bacterium]|nr:hypothetical protein [Tissierellia bacterium]
MNNKLQDLNQVYKRAGAESLKTLKKFPYLVLLPILYSILRTLVASAGALLFGNMGFLWGFVYVFLLAAIISSYFYILNSAIIYKKLSLLTFKNSFKPYLRNIYSVFFILWIAELLLFNVLRQMLDYRILISLNLLIYIALNAIPEAIYLRGLYGASAFKYSAEFIKENWYLWILPIILGAIVQSYPITFSTTLNIMDLPFGNEFGLMLKSPIHYIILQILGGFMMIFRGYLFLQLSGSTLRKRMYMGYR